MSKEINEEMKALHKQLEGLKRKMLVKMIINLTIKLMSIEQEIRDAIKPKS